MKVVVARRLIVGRILFRLLVLLLAGLILLWMMRVPITRHYIDRELSRRGVHVAYRLGHIGFNVERLENVVIGDPAKPDLTARQLELQLGWGLRKPRINLITARGVRLRGRLVNKQITFGEVDKLMETRPSGVPFRLPDQAVNIADSALLLDTPAGPLAISIQGRGNLASGFRGTIAASAHRLLAGECGIMDATGSWAASVDQRQFHLVGPARFDRLDCAQGPRFKAGRLEMDAVLPPGLDGWTGSGTAAAGFMQLAGTRVTGVASRFYFKGNAGRTTGQVLLSAANVRASRLRVARVWASGTYALGLKSARFGFSGDVHASRIQGAKGVMAPVLAGLSAARGTPVGPVTEAWSVALSRVEESGIDAAGTVRVAVAPGGGEVRANQLSVVSRTGAHLAFGGGSGVSYSWRGGATLVNGGLSMLGGGLPGAQISLSQPGSGQPIQGVGHMAPYEVGSARLALDAIRFAVSPGGVMAFQTVARVDGPFVGGGWIAGLVLPISGHVGRRSGFAFGESCTSASFASMLEGSLRLSSARLSLCPTGRALLWKPSSGVLQGQASLTGARLIGSLGSSPFSLAAQDLRIRLDGRHFTGTGIAMRLGGPDRVSLIQIASLTGSPANDGAAGSYRGVSGKVAAAPIRGSEGHGRWQFAGGALVLAGSMSVSDEQSLPRFNPLRTDDLRLTFARNRVHARGWLKEPKTGARILEARIDHDLPTGTGRAVLDVPGVTFDERFQPEELTRLTVGTVELVRGTVKGRGEIGWNAKGVTSDGIFSTEGMSLAASFGPVEGLTTAVHFTDLLGVVSGAHQAAQAKAIHSGVDVFDGLISYQLLPDQRVKVEGATWPFAGGALTLDETLLDFSKPSPKHLTFHVNSMDGSRFIQQMQFSNISGSGTFDGIVPMVFDESGGHIAGGRLVARDGGGTLSYIGELTDKQLGTYGELAFDALKSLRYSRLTIDLNGALDGEFLAGIRLDGIARDPSIAKASTAGVRGVVIGRGLGQLAKIPFKFNISVRGPFRAVMGTARSLQDPTNLIQSVLPQMLGENPKTTSVQPKESARAP